MVAAADLVLRDLMTSQGGPSLAVFRELKSVLTTESRSIRMACLQLLHTCLTAEPLAIHLVRSRPSQYRQLLM